MNYIDPYSANTALNLRNIINQATYQLNQLQAQPIQPNVQPQPQNGFSNFKIVEDIKAVESELVFIDTYFLARDYKTLWLKNPRGDIRTFDVKEIVPKDEKDLLIEDLQRQIFEMKGSMNNVGANVVTKTYEPITEKESTNV